MNITESVIDLREELERAGNVQLLQDVVYTGRVFTRFSLGMEDGIPARVQHVTFDRCQTAPGTALILRGATLREVRFIEFDCGEQLRIDAEAVLDDVSVQGDSPKTLWISPSMASETSPSRQVEHDRYHLDVSKFRGEVVIAGIPAHRVSIDPDRHLRLELKRFEGFDWRAEGIDGTSFLKLCVQKLENLSVAEGVFSLPTEDSPLRKPALVQLERLRSLGCIA